MFEPFSWLVVDDFCKRSSHEFLISYGNENCTAEANEEEWNCVIAKNWLEQNVGDSLEDVNFEAIAAEKL